MDNATSTAEVATQLDVLNTIAAGLRASLPEPFQVMAYDSTRHLRSADVVVLRDVEAHGDWIAYWTRVGATSWTAELSITSRGTSRPTAHVTAAAKWRGWTVKVIHQHPASEAQLAATEAEAVTTDA